MARFPNWVAHYSVRALLLANAGSTCPQAGYSVWMRLWMLLMMLCALNGCLKAPLSGEAEAAAADPQRKAAGDAVWWPSPTTVSLHPLSRLEGRQLVALLEVRDQHGHAIKAPAQLWFELVRGKRADDTTAPWVRWRKDLTTAQDQQAHFDPVTRAYLLRLDLPGAPNEDKDNPGWTVRAGAEVPGGVRLRTVQVLR